MDRVTAYQQIIERILLEIEGLRPSTESVRETVIFDRQRNRFGLVAQGWENKRRIHRMVVHLEIRDEKIWIEVDATDLNIARELELAGVPKSDIVLGFHPPDIRPYTDYAAA